MELNFGDVAPDFTLADQEGNSHTLSKLKGNWVFLFFYPKDNTPGCTKEACSIRDIHSNLQKKNLVVFGVNPGSMESHKKFVEKYTLSYPILVDEDKEVVKKYGVWGTKKMFGREYESTFRTSFLIDPEGKIAKIYKKVKPAVHAEELLKDFDQFLQEYSSKN